MSQLGLIFKRMQITPKVFILTFICFEILTLLMAFSFNNHSSSVLVKSQMKYAQETTDKSNRYLDLNLQNVHVAISSIVNDSRLQNGDYKQLEAWVTTNLNYFTTNLLNIHFISNEVVLASSSYHSWDLLSDPVIQKLLSRESAEAAWIGPYYSKVSGYTLTYATPITIKKGTVGLVLADISLERLYYNLFPNDSSDVMGDLMLLDVDMNPIIGKKPYMTYDFIENQYHFSGFDPTLLRSNWAQKEAVDLNSHDSIIMTRSYNSLLGWQLVMVMNKSELLAPLKQSLRYSWLLVSFSFVLSIALSLFITFMISRPIKKITKSVQEVGAGNLTTSISLDRQDEIGYLAFQFNLMIRKVEQLVLDLKYSEEQKKLSDFRALHAQIKPHFIYNTLNTISMLGRRGDSEKMDLLISALSNQLHYALDSSPIPVTLREELIMVENYVELMKIRYPDKCRFVIDIDPLSLEFRLPKFILQPLVENAIFHGVVPNETGGQVYIGTMVDEDYWEILIEDDGVGMDDEALRTIMEKLQNTAAAQNSEHIGILNIHERFRLMFGELYSIYLDSEPGIGTKLWIKLPKERIHSDETSTSD